MTIDFPNFPVLNDTYVADGITFTWNGDGWVASSLGRLIDEDDMISDTTFRAPTQQSAKAYADAANVPADFVTEIDGFLGTTGWQGSGLGPTGFFGSLGFTGSAGPDGADGFVGSQGDLGFQGSVGLTGSTPPGVQGSVGYTGSQGFAGSQGITGFDGSATQGPVGSVGFTGSEGAGFVGSQGIVGFTGSEGVGFTGSQGIVGFTGSEGRGFSYETLTGVNQDLDVGSHLFFDGGDLDATKTLSFSNLPSEAEWTWSTKIIDITSISSVTYNSVSFSVSAQTGVTVRGLKIDNNGTKMYVVSWPTIYQYTLGTAWDLSTASYDSVSFSVGSQTTTPYDVHFDDTGTKMYVVGTQVPASVYQYTLGTAYDISTASYDSVSFNVSGQATDAFSIEFNSTGTKMFMAGGISLGGVFQYTLGTAWDLSTASYDSVSISLSGVQTCHTFANSGSKLYVVDWDADNVREYTLSTSYDISTAVFDGILFSVASQDTAPHGIEINSNRDTIIILGDSSDTAYEYSATGDRPQVTLPAAVSNASSITTESADSSKQLVLDFYTNDSGTTVYLIEKQII